MPPQKQQLGKLAPRDKLFYVPFMSGVIMRTIDALIRKAPDGVKASYANILDYLHDIKEHNYLLDDWD